MILSINEPLTLTLSRRERGLVVSSFHGERGLVVSSFHGERGLMV